MSLLFFTVLFYAAAVLQSWAAMRDAALAGPNWLVLAAFLWLCQLPSRRALLLAGLAGLMCDLNSSLPLGLNTAVFTSVAYVVVWLRQRMRLDGLAAQLGVIWFAAAGITLVQGIFVKYFAAGAVTFDGLIECSSLAGLYTMLVATPILVIASWRRIARESFVEQFG
jgi:rod shape-determining protein MreD